MNRRPSLNVLPRQALESLDLQSRPALGPRIQENQLSLTGNQSGLYGDSLTMASGLPGRANVGLGNVLSAADLANTNLTNTNLAATDALFQQDTLLEQLPVTTNSSGRAAASARSSGAAIRPNALVSASGAVAASSSIAAVNIPAPQESRAPAPAPFLAFNSDLLAEGEGIIAGPPSGTDDYYMIPHSTQLSVPPSGVLANDIPMNGSAYPLSATLETGPLNAASFSFNTDGSFTYDPQPGWTGDDTFTYIPADALSGGGLSTMVTISVFNGPPVAVDDYVFLQHDTSFTADATTGVLSNDYEGDGTDPLTATLLTNPGSAAGFSFAADGAFSYTPIANWAGLDSFDYELSDGIDTDIGTVYFTIDNMAPITLDDNYTVIYNTQRTVSAADGVLSNDFDMNGDALTASLKTSPAHGTLALSNDGSFTFTPTIGYEGPDSFQYYASDGVAPPVAETVLLSIERPIVDIDTDSDNNQMLEESLAEDNDEENSPGKVLRYNGNDDNGNGLVDRTDPAPFVDANNIPVLDNDLKPVTFKFNTIDAEAALAGFTLNLEVGSNVKLWKTQDKQALPLTYLIGTNPLPSTFYAEGFDYGPDTVSAVLLNPAGVEVSRDAVLFTVARSDLKGYRPQTAPFARTPVPFAEEESPGVGIRRNGDDDNGNGLPDRLDMGGVAGEDDLIEVEVFTKLFNAPGLRYELTRGETDINVFATAAKTTALLDYTSGNTVVFTPTADLQSIWVEWVGTSGSGAPTADLTLTAYDAVHDTLVWSDTITFDPFESIVIVFLGEFQVPADPVPLQFRGMHGVNQFAIDEYRNGYNVYVYDEDVLSSYGAGAPYDEVVNAINKQGITNVAIMGYSHGGGATYNLAWRLNENVKASPTLTDITNPFTVPFTAYIDAIALPTLNPTAENRRPLLSAFHVNQYQNITDGWPDGGPAGGDPIDYDRSGIPNIYHDNIDDDPTVLGLIRTELHQKVSNK